ncbi:MAG: hypothetical protein HY062_15765 [Bacteroidetes bacterium]|nr:hypothetical protein [Bacteroidota bacterium]
MILKPYSAFGIVLIFSLMLLSCKKEDPDQSCGTCPIGGPSQSSGLTFTRNNGASITADSATFNPSFSTITAYYQGVTHRISIKTSSQLPGTYNFTTTANTLYYIETSATYYAIGGYINITSNANNKLSGNFVSNGTGGGYTSINGQFKDIPKR